MSQSIYREVALERLSTPEQLDQTIRITNSAGWLALWTVLALIVVVAVWSAIDSVPIQVSGRGILIQPGGILNVVAASEGRLTALLVQPGDAVEEGEVVAHVAQPVLQQELAMAKAELAELVEEEQSLRDFHGRAAAAEAGFNAQKREDLRQSIGFLRERLELARERHQGEQELWDKQVIPQQRLVSTKLEINQAHEELARTTAAINLIGVEENANAIAREREILASTMRTSAARRRAASLEEALRRDSAVVSAYAGSVMELKVNPGEIVGLGTPLLSLLPPAQDVGAGRASAEQAPTAGQDLVAIVYLPPAEGKRVRLGMEVRVGPTTVRREEFGFIIGRVQQVARISSTGEGMMRVLKNEPLVRELSGGGAPIEVRAELLKDTTNPTGYRWSSRWFSSSRGPDIEINTGTLIDADITIRRVRLLSLIIPGLEPVLDSVEPR
jgi:HlyD family secretion protein